MARKMERAEAFATQNKVIDAVRHHRCLWDKFSDDYRNVRSREAAWIRVSQIVFGSTKEKNEAIYVTQCQNIWTELRGQYSKFRKKRLLKSIEGKVATSICFRHEEAMSFLMEITPSNTVASSDVKDLVTHKEKSEFENTTSDLPELKLESQPPIQLEAESSENPLVVPAGLSSPFLCRTEPTDELPIPTGRSYNWKRKLDSVDAQGMYCYCRNAVEEDEFDTFGKTLAIKFRKLTSLNRRAFLELELKINSLLYEYEMNELEIGNF